MGAAVDFFVEVLKEESLAEGGELGEGFEGQTRSAGCIFGEPLLCPLRELFVVAERFFSRNREVSIKIGIFFE